MRESANDRAKRLAEPVVLANLSTPKMNWGGPANAREGDICPCCWSPYMRIDDEPQLMCACDL